MRLITPTEARVVQALLSGSSAGSLSSPGLGTFAPRTVQETRRRIFLRGWVENRFVPDPVASGRPILTFGLIRPYSDRTKELRERWSSDSRTVLLWASPDLLFGVFSETDSTEAQSLQSTLGPLTEVQTAFFLDCDCRAATLPVFFDFEGAWVKSVRLPGTFRYPIP